MPESTDYLEIKIPWRTISRMSDEEACRIESLIGKGLEMGLIQEAVRWDEPTKDGWQTVLKIRGDIPAIRQLLPEAKSE